MIKINEGKQVGVLYHFTSINNLISILDRDMIRGNDENPEDRLSISLTRNKNFYMNSSIDFLEARLVLDGNKISDMYKIEPYNYFYDNPDESGYDEPEKHYAGLEAEERIVDKHLVKLHKYLIRVDLLAPKLSNQLWTSAARNTLSELCKVKGKVDSFDIAEALEKSYKIPFTVLGKVRQDDQDQ